MSRYKNARKNNPIIKPPTPNLKHRNIIIASSIITKILLFVSLIEVFHIFIDLYDYNLYIQSVQNIFNGLLPWANNVVVFYPPLAFIPMIISYFVAELFNNGLGFAISMWVFLAICDIITTLCIYYIGLKIYSEKTAYVAALLYATAISVAYYSLTKYDAFPVCLSMIAITATIYGEQTKGYLTSVFGLFVKIWPIILYPFLWIYNSKVKDNKSHPLGILILTILFFAGMIVFGYNGFLGYTTTVYCNTIVYLISQYIPIQLSTLIIIFHILTIAIIFGMIYHLYKQPKSEIFLLKVIFVSIIAMVLLMQYRSPQYSIWFIPIAALLLATDVWGIILFVGVQIISFIEFPVFFWSVYTNTQYTSPWAPVFFAVFFIMYGVMLWRVWNAERFIMY